MRRGGREGESVREGGGRGGGGVGGTICVPNIQTTLLVGMC